jgi:HEAT repeat protein
MAIHFQCRRCRHALSVRSRQAGTPVICPSCKGETLAPSASERSRPAPVPVPVAAPPAIMGPPRLGILVASPAPRPVPVAAPAPAAPPPASQPPAPVPPPHRPFLNRRYRAVAAAALLLLAVGLLAYMSPPLDTLPPIPDDELALAPDAQAAENEPDNLIAALAPGEEEWLEERPLPDGPDDPAEPSLTPPGIDVPKVPATAVAPPLPAPGALARFKRRDLLGEEEQRKRLAQAPEIGLERSLMSTLVWEHKEQQEEGLVNFGTPNLEPTPLLAVYPGVKGLSIRHGREAQLDPRRAATLDALSRKLRVYVAHFAPADRDGKRAGAAQLRNVMYAEMRGPKPEWLRAEAIPVLMQMLTHEDVVLRRLLVEILSEIKHRTATTALAQRAVCDLDADIRAFAIESLQSRPSDDYREVFLRALRHPLPMMADHAAEALVALKTREAVPALVTMLKEPDPTASYVGKDGRPLVREVVRTNHLANCLLCHPPSVSYFDPVPGVIPNARWMYPVVGITPAMVTRTTFKTSVTPIIGRRSIPQTPSTPATPARPGTPPPPTPSTTSQQSVTSVSSSQLAQQIITGVNNLTSQTTSTGTTKQTGCHDYSASTNIVNNLIVPSTPPPPPSKPSPGNKSGNQSGGQTPTKGQPTTPPAKSPATTPQTPPAAVAGGGPAPARGPTSVPVRGVQLRQSTSTRSRIVPQEDVTVVNLPLLVRGDVTYLRQDFSVQQPVLDVPGPQPTFVNMRFDYLVRVRRATADEAKAPPARTYEQREAVLFALRELTGRDLGDTTEAWQRQYPDSELDNQAERLAAELVRADAKARPQVLARLRDGKGPVYTDALAAAIGRLDGPARDRARAALVERLTRMTAATLRNKLGDESTEVRRAAALACAHKEDEGHVPDLVPLLDDPDEGVARAAREALELLRGKDAE